MFLNVVCNELVFVDNSIKKDLKSWEPVSHSRKCEVNTCIYTHDVAEF